MAIKKSGKKASDRNKEIGMNSGFTRTIRPQKSEILVMPILVWQICMHSLLLYLHKCIQGFYPKGLAKAEFSNIVKVQFN